MNNETQDNRIGIIIILVGAALIALGSILPWASVSSPFGTMSFPGTEGDGMITLIIAALIALGAWWLWSRPAASVWVRVILALLTLIVLVTGFEDITNVSDFIAANDTSELAVASVGAGLYVLMLGGLTILVGIAILSRKRAAAAEQTITEHG